MSWDNIEKTIERCGKMPEPMWEKVLEGLAKDLAKTSGEYRKATAQKAFIYSTALALKYFDKENLKSLIDKL